MLFDKNGLYFVDGINDNDNYDFAVDIMNGMVPTTNNYPSMVSTNMKLFNPEEALKRGNSFPGLYDPYKGFRPMELRVSSQREKALLEIQKLDFIINDLNLYLDLNPDDNYAFQLFKKYVEECKSRKSAYARTYGPLVLEDTEDEYEWSKGVWPWEEGMM